MSDEALAKTGEELFKEVVRLYDTAEFGDYFIKGKWADELMKMDLVLVAAHRKEAGAPDAPALEDVVMPEMQATPMLASVLSGPMAAHIAAQGVAAKPAGMGMAGVPAGGAVAELRLIALFVSKWKLDPTKTKALLSTLAPPRRRYVIQNFKSAVPGEGATAELEAFIAECEANGNWDKVGAVAAVAPAMITPGLKRPLVVNPAFNPAAKRPAFTVAPTMIAPGAGNSLAARLAAARAAGGAPQPMAVRPPAWAAGARPVGVFNPNVRPNMVRPQMMNNGW